MGSASASRLQSSVFVFGSHCLRLQEAGRSDRPPKSSDRPVKCRGLTHLSLKARKQSEEMLLRHLQRCLVTKSATLGRGGAGSASRRPFLPRARLGVRVILGLPRVLAGLQKRYITELTALRYVKSTVSTSSRNFCQMWVAKSQQECLGKQNTGQSQP